jgi:predicted nucleic acid-binding protein
MAWLEGHARAATRVEALLGERPIMSWINLGEVYYVVRRRVGEREADETVRDLRPMLDLDLPTTERVLSAASLKAEHPIAYADAFAVATAIARGATLVTGDPELLDAELDVDIEDIR